MDSLSKHLKSLGVTEPTLILDAQKARRNIERMYRKAKQAGVEFRPHFKTHQSAEIGQWFQDLGVNKITVSSLDMADYFARAGWQDITVAFPVNVLEIDKINALAKSINLNLLVDSMTSLRLLREKLHFGVDIWIKVDIGYGRVGVHWQEPEKISKLVREISGQEKLRFSGLLTHFGHSYHATSAVELEQIYQKSTSRLFTVKNELNRAGFQNVRISIGDTPCCSVEQHFTGIDEIRPGNFVFYDLSQNHYHACSDEEIAVAVACPVVGKYEARKQIALYGGAVHFSKEFLIDEQKEKIFGYLAAPENNRWSKADKRGRLISVSQEHGLLQVSDELFARLNIGDLVCILPVHACLTANLYRDYFTLQGQKISRFQSFY